MMKVYACPGCLVMKIASMRRALSCPNCRKEMTRLDLTFLEYSEMSETQRNAYVKDWSSGAKKDAV